MQNKNASSEEIELWQAYYDAKQLESEMKEFISDYLTPRCHECLEPIMECDCEKPSKLRRSGGGK